MKHKILFLNLLWFVLAGALGPLDASTRYINGYSGLIIAEQPIDRVAKYRNLKENNHLTQHHWKSLVLIQQSPRLRNRVVWEKSPGDMPLGLHDTVDPTT